MADNPNDLLMEEKFIEALDKVRPNWWVDFADHQQLQQLAKGYTQPERLKRAIARDIGQTMLHAGYISGIVQALGDKGEGALTVMDELTEEQIATIAG